MIRTILVPLDGSALAEAALPHARRLARLTQATMVLVRVVAGGPPRRDAVYTQDRAIREARTYLRRNARGLSLHGLSVQTAVLVDDPVSGIASAVQMHHADLIVMCTHGRSGLGRLLLGSVAERVLQTATVPLLLVPARSADGFADPAPIGPYRKVLVPLDGSTFAEQAVRYLAEQEWAREAELLLVQSEPTPVVPVGAAPGLPGALPEPDLVAMDQEAGRACGAARRYLLDAAHRCAADHVTHAYATIGEPGAAIVHIAMDQEAELIVMATHARTGLERLLSGSVAAQVVTHAPVPVLLLRGADALEDR